MPVKIYVQLDENGRELPPTHTHESEAALSIIKQLWLKYSDQPTIYAIAINLHRPTADFAIISERGIGIIDLKDYPGVISGQPDSQWKHTYRGKTDIINAGKKDGKDRTNPQDQILDYSIKINQMLIDFNQQQAFQDRWNTSDVRRFFVNKAVCFTHPKAVIEPFRTNYYPLCSKRNMIKILKPKEVSDWAFSISFQTEQEREVRGGRSYTRYILKEQQIASLATNTYAFGLAESNEIPGLMPEDEPYGWLIRIRDGHVKKCYPLDRQNINIGRSLSCQVALMSDYKYVSREHARITRRIIDGAVSIADRASEEESEGSKNGTFVTRSNKTVQLRVNNPIKLKPGDVITLGGRADAPGVCMLEYSLTPPPPLGTAINLNIWNA